MPRNTQTQFDAAPSPPVDTRAKLTRTSIVLHWTVAISMIGMLAFGLYLEQLERGDAKSALIGLHKSFGSLILFLVIARIWWRTRQGSLDPWATIPDGRRLRPGPLTTSCCSAPSPCP